MIVLILNYRDRHPTIFYLLVDDATTKSSLRDQKKFEKYLGLDGVAKTSLVILQQANN